MNANRATKTSKLVGGLALSAIMLTGASGCNNAGEGLFTGAGLGALAGMGIGAMSGNMGEGAAVGAILGGVTGLFVGDQNDRNSHYHGYNYYPD